jgi:RHS repeat-associated protein
MRRPLLALLMFLAVVAPLRLGAKINLPYTISGNTAALQTSWSYSYDFDNRLVLALEKNAGASYQALGYQYAYDYRGRRVARESSNSPGYPGPLAYTWASAVFSGGTSVREYSGNSSASGEWSLFQAWWMPAWTVGNTTLTPSVEYVRGSDWGGGVGGVLYSLHGSGNSTTANFYHYDGRGDVVAQTSGASGNLVYQANYNAYGEHNASGYGNVPAAPGTQEWSANGTVTDDLRANTKEEDPTGLLYEGQRYRMIGTDFWMTPDPAGMVDGTNMYGYVKENPWTKFDPLGLYYMDGVQPVSNPQNTAELEGAVYANTVGSAVHSYQSGEQHMEGGFTEIANAHSAMDVTIGTLGIVAATGDATGAVMAVTPEGKVEKVAAEGAEKLVAKEGEQAVAASVEQKTEATVSSSAKADAQKAATATDKATDKTYQTYTKTNPETGEVYTGRTSGTGTPEENVANRDVNHHMNDQGFGPAKLDKSSSNPDAIRGREQQQIEANGGAKSQGGTSGNAINGVSAKNPKADQYKNAANQEFGGN